MSVRALCNRKPALIQRQAKVVDAAKLMKKRNVGSLVVMDGVGLSAPIGMITDRDIALKATGAGLNGAATVEEVMTKKIVSVPATAGIADAIEKMEKNGVRRVVVRDASNRVCGVVSSDDILQLVAREVFSMGRLVEKQSLNKR